MSCQTVFEGVYSALPTPMTQEREVDLEGLLNLMAWQLEPRNLCDEGLLVERSDLERRGVSGFVLYGTTGEASTLTIAEREVITTRSVERYPEHTLIAGVGTNSTVSSAELATQARSWGADAGLLVTPYYNRPSQEGLYRHVLQVAESVPDWPLILYIVPSRAAVTIEVNTLDRILNACPQVVAIKDASADLAYGVEVIRCCEGRATVLSGDDPTALASWAIGAQGSISVMSNLFPAEMMTMFRLFQRGQLTSAQSLFHLIHPVIQALFIDTNPVPLKCILAELSRQGRIPLNAPLLEYVRPPLVELNSLHREFLFEEVLSRITGRLGSTL